VLDSLTLKIHILIHVKFIETLFLFTLFFGKPPLPQPSAITTWILTPLKFTIISLASPLISQFEMEVS
jgi:hypothetical protein